tara:strand:- start:89 stop:784 length:696 start_codon:yes stop_codon:yes gene_type:complete
MVLPALAGAILPTVAGSVATFGLSKLFGGGGSSRAASPGGYGAIRFDPYELAGKFRDNFTEDLYMPKDDFGDLAGFFSQNINKNPMFDRNYALSTLSSYANPNEFLLNKEVQDMMTGKVGRRKSKDLIADEFRLASKGQIPSQSFVDDTYKSLKRSGQLGSPSSITSGASQQIAALFPEYRTKSAEEYALMSRFGPGKIDPESGALLFRMPDTIKASRMKSAALAKEKGLA